MAILLPILTFHTLDDWPSVISCSPHVFQRSMAKLHAHGYQTLRLLEAVSYLRQGRPFPDRAFVLTFDDGYQTVYTEALPVLQRYSMSATVFLTVGTQGTASQAGRLPSLEGRVMLSWREIREMQRGGIAFGAHTCTHPDLTQLPAAQIEAEVCTSKRMIEDALSAPVTCFAYPFGRYDARSCHIVRPHFACAVSDTLGLLTAGSDPYALKRVDTYYLRTERLFALMLSRLFPWYVWARNVPRQLRRTLQGYIEQ